MRQEIFGFGEAQAADDFANAVEAAGAGGLVLADSGRDVRMEQVVLTNVTVRGTLRRVGQNVFRGCTALPPECVR